MVEKEKESRKGERQKRWEKVGEKSVRKGNLTDRIVSR
jgi:hypothetical protein